MIFFRFLSSKINLPKGGRTVKVFALIEQPAMDDSINNTN
jgi:hypothetical protein